MEKLQMKSRQVTHGTNTSMEGKHIKLNISFTYDYGGGLSSGH